MMRIIIQVLIYLVSLALLPLRLLTMAWTAPTTRATGDLVTAAIWNTDLVDNLSFLHARYGMIFAGVGRATALQDQSGFYTSNLGNGQTANINLCVPDDYASLVSAELILFDQDTGTLQYDINTQYGNPDNTENYNANTGAVSNATLAVTASRLYSINIASLLASLSAGDYVGVQFNRDSNSGGVNGTKVIGVRIVYSRS